MTSREPEKLSSYPWKNAECKAFSFDPEWVESEECDLREEEAVVVATGVYAPASTEAKLWPKAA